VRDHFRKPPNQLSAFRLVLVPLLWAAAGFGQSAIVAVGLALGALSDILDGFLARRFDMQSEFGSRLDAIADTLTLLSAVGWVLLLQPQLIEDHPFLLAIAIGLATASLIVGWVRHRQVADLHLSSSRLAAIVCYPFVVHALLTDGYVEPWFYLGIGVTIVASVEALLIHQRRDGLLRPAGSLIDRPFERQP
jgi:CDP-diacylglycerol--glycerol-3-phosphate 3-phosphatidyltransferase